KRIEAMIAAVATVRPPLEKLYGELNDEQKARLAALGNEERQGASKGNSVAQNCGAAQTIVDWPSAQIEQSVQPTHAQRASLRALQDAIAKAADLLKTSCPTDSPITPTARLAAVGKRLEIMLQAVKSVRSAVDDFYAALTDEQKAQFDAIGQEPER